MCRAGPRFPQPGRVQMLGAGVARPPGAASGPRGFPRAAQSHAESLESRRCPSPSSPGSQCGSCIAYRRGAQGRHGDAMLAELIAVVGMVNETNRLASGYQVEIDDRFMTEGISVA